MKKLILLLTVILCSVAFFGFISISKSKTLIKPYHQEYTITGVVTDSETHDPLSGALVTLKGTNVHVLTNDEGKYSIKVPSLDKILIFSYVGYTTQEIPIAGRSVINVALVPLVALY